MKIMFCRYECGYGQKDHHEDPNHTRSIKCGCLAHFSIERLYAWPKVAEIIIYHWIHIWANGDLIHGACDPWSTSQMSTYGSTYVLQVERFYMDLIRVEIHREVNLWQAQGNLVGKGECRWANDTRWLAKIPRYHLLELKAQKGHLALAQKLNIFYLIMGLCSS